MLWTQFDAEMWQWHCLMADRRSEYWEFARVEGGFE